MANIYNDEKFNKAFPDRLRTIMGEKKVSQQKLADEVGMTRQAISNYMNAHTGPDWETLAKIAAYFNVSSDWLIGISKIRSSAASMQSAIAETGLTEKTIEILKADNNLKVLFEIIANCRTEEFSKSLKEVFSTASTFSRFRASRLKYEDEEGNSNYLLISVSDVLFGKAGKVGTEISNMIQKYFDYYVRNKRNKLKYLDDSEPRYFYSYDEAGNRSDTEGVENNAEENDS